MKKIYIVIMLLMLWMPCKANQIDIKAKTTTPREGARMPSALRVEASCNAGMVTLKSATIIQYTIKGRFMSR